MILLYSAYLLTGVLSSFLSGLLGIGGGLIIVPALMFVFSYFHIIHDQVLMPVVFATSLASSIANLSLSVISHQKHGNIRWDLFRRIIPSILLGAFFLGPFLMSFLSGSLLARIFGVACFFFSAHMFFPMKKSTGEEHLPGNWILSFLGVIIGTLSTLLGLAGGIMIGSLLNYCDMNMRKIIGTTAMIAIVLALAGSLGSVIIGHQTENTLPPECFGFVYWPALLCLAIPSPLFAPLGAKIAQKLPVSLLKKCFASLILLVGIKMII